LNPRHMYEHQHDGLISAVSFGGFLIILGLIFVATPDLWQHITSFFDNLTTQAVPLGSGTSNVVLPAPANPAAHQALYKALINFDAAIGALQVILLVMGVGLHVSTGKIAEKVGDLVFWFGAAVLVQIFLLQGTLGSWFQYWAALIILIGITLIARAFVHFIMRR